MSGVTFDASTVDGNGTLDPYDTADDDLTRGGDLHLGGGRGMAVTKMKAMARPEMIGTSAATGGAQSGQERPVCWGGWMIPSALKSTAYGGGGGTRGLVSPSVLESIKLSYDPPPVKVVSDESGGSHSSSGEKQSQDGAVRRSLEMEGVKGGGTPIRDACSPNDDTPRRGLVSSSLILARQPSITPQTPKYLKSPENRNKKGDQRQDQQHGSLFDCLACEALPDLEGMMRDLCPAGRETEKEITQADVDPSGNSNGGSPSLATAFPTRRAGHEEPHNQQPTLAIAPLAMDEAALHERGVLLRGAARMEAEGDHAAALERYCRCLEDYHHLVPPLPPSSTGDSEEDADGGPSGTIAPLPPGASIEAAEVLHRIGVVRWKSGLYPEAETALNLALSIYRATFIPQPDLTTQYWDEKTGREFRHNIKADAFASVLDSLGRVHLSSGEYLSAMKCHRESLAVQEFVYTDQDNLPGGSGAMTDDDDLTADTGLTGEESRYSKSSRRSTASSAGHSQRSADWRTLPPHPSVARTAIAIGTVFNARGQYRKSMKRYRAGLRAQRMCLGDGHVDVAATLNSMGSVHEKSGRHDKAMECYSEALWIYRSRLGNDHVDVAVTLNNVGQVHHHWAEYDMAMTSYVEALRIMRRVLGDSHRNVAATLHNVGLVSSAKGDHDKALKIFREVLKSQRASLGDGHIDVAVTLDAIGEAYEGRGRNDRAHKFYSKALQVRRSVLGRTHPFVAVTLERIGRFHLERDGNLPEARRRLEEARGAYLSYGGGVAGKAAVAEMDEQIKTVRNRMKAEKRRAGGEGGKEGGRLKRRSKSRTPKKPDQTHRQ